MTNRDFTDFSYVADNYKPGMMDIPTGNVPRPDTSTPGPFDAAYLAAARAGDGWTHAPGDDPGLPDEVRDAVERTAADTEHEVGPEVTTVDRAARMSHDLQHVTMAFVEAAEGITEGMRAVAEAAAPAAEAMARAWAPVGAAIARGFGTLVYVTDGPAPGPVVDEATALAALAYAESTRVVQHPRKGHRRNAKRAYLAVKRHLAPEHRARFRKVPMRQFGAL